MKDLSNYNIDIYKLSNAKHKYLFEVDNAFFSHFDYGLIKKGQAKVQLVLDKRETFIEVLFKINGFVELTCDRSLEKFESEFDLIEGVIFKYGEEEEEISDDIIIISKGTQRINIAQYIYEFIGLTVPFKKIHPKYADEYENDQEATGVMVYSDIEKAKKTEDQEKQAEIDPRWNALKKLKNK